MRNNNNKYESGDNTRCRMINGNRWPTQNNVDGTSKEEVVQYSGRL